MRVIGLTGGVGSGKTLAGNLLQEISGGELLITDQLGHVAMERESQGYQKILARFGRGILAPDGEIDRGKLGELVFGDEEKLRQLNEIVHPRVLAYLESYFSERQGQEGLIILESAILFETGCSRFCEEVWYMWVPEAVRIQRLQESRGYSREKCGAIMARQLSEEIFLEKCRRRVVNDGSVEELEQTLREMYSDFSRRCRAV